MVAATSPVGANEARQRLLEHVERAPGEDGCWLWRGPLQRDGYPLITVEGRRVAAAPLVVLALEGRTPPPGAYLRRSCGNRLCVKPRHLVATPKVESFPPHKRGLG